MRFTYQGYRQEVVSNILYLGSDEAEISRTSYSDVQTRSAPATKNIPCLLPYHKQHCRHGAHATSLQHLCAYISCLSPERQIKQNCQKLSSRKKCVQGASQLICAYNSSLGCNGCSLNSVNEHTCKYFSDQGTEETQNSFLHSTIFTGKYMFLYFSDVTDFIIQRNSLEKVSVLCRI